VDEELKQRVLSYMDATERMVSSEMPLVAQEYLSLVFYAGTAGCVACGLVAVASGIALFMSTRTPWDFEDARPMVGFASCILIAVAIAIFSINSYELLRVSIAPRVVLLEKAADLIGDGK
jgi:hypothetical protein